MKLETETNAGDGMASCKENFVPGDKDANINGILPEGVTVDIFGEL